MSMMQSRNPAMGAFERYGDAQIASSETRSTSMTISGTVTASGVLLGIVAAGGIAMWSQIDKAFAATGNIPGWAWGVTFGGALLGFIVSLVISFKPKSAPLMAPLCAVFQAVFVGGFTFVIPMSFVPYDPASGPNPSAMIALQAAVTTFSVMGVLLVGYAAGFLRVGPMFKRIMITALLGLVGYSFLIFILSLFGVGIWNGYADTGAMGIAFTAGCAFLAAMFLLLDFEFIERGVKAGAPKYMEWVGAWGLMITLVWLYIELVRLFAKLRSGD